MINCMVLGLLLHISSKISHWLVHGYNNPQTLHQIHVCTSQDSQACWYVTQTCASNKHLDQLWLLWFSHILFNKNCLVVLSWKMLKKSESQLVKNVHPSSRLEKIKVMSIIIELKPPIPEKLPGNSQTSPCCFSQTTPYVKSTEEVHDAAFFALRKLDPSLVKMRLNLI